MVATRPTHTMTARIDIAVYQGEQLQLVVEVKSKTGATAEWAAQMRRNLAAHLDIPTSPFFLLALPDRFYLWNSIASLFTAIPPDFDIDSVPLLEPYIRYDRQEMREISEYGLALAVSSWLTDLTAGSLDEEKLGPKYAWLFESGLCSAIEGGTVRTDISA